MALPLSQPLRQQLSKRYRATLLGGSCSRFTQPPALQRLQPGNRNINSDRRQGRSQTQTPDRVTPIRAKQLVPFALPTDLRFFTNPCVFPLGFGQPGFDLEQALAPKFRLANIGFLVVTLEFDPTTRDHFEEMFSWCRGKGGKFANSALAGVSRELSRFTDYRGICVVYSGRRSLHLHFVFSTKHLKAAPYAAGSEERRLTCQEVSALMHNAHDQQYDQVIAIVKDRLQPSFAADAKMRCATQWRRMGGAVRIVDKPVPFLGLHVGCRVPQLIMGEIIRDRAPKGATTYLISPDISLLRLTPSRPRNFSPSVPPAAYMTEAIKILQEDCLHGWNDPLANACGS